MKRPCREPWTHVQIIVGQTSTAVFERDRSPDQRDSGTTPRGGVEVGEPSERDPFRPWVSVRRVVATRPAWRRVPGVDQRRSTMLCLPRDGAGGDCGEPRFDALLLFVGMSADIAKRLGWTSCSRQCLTWYPPRGSGSRYAAMRFPTSMTTRTRCRSKPLGRVTPGGFSATKGPHHADLRILDRRGGGCPTLWGSRRGLGFFPRVGTPGLLMKTKTRCWAAARPMS